MSDPDDSELPERRFGWWDMFVAPEDDPRTDGGYVGERATLLGYLADQRLTLRMKCAGLDAAALARRSVPPSDLSLLGLIRHLTTVEQAWFRIRLAGEDVPRLYRDGGVQGEFTGAVPEQAVVDEAYAVWEAEMAYGDAFLARTDDLGFVGPQGDQVRSVLVHLIEEYARHNGHADLLRERIDGRVGQ